MKYYLKEFRPGCWTIHHEENGLAIFTDDHDGTDHIMIWHDEDAAYDCLQRLNGANQDET